VRKLRIYPLGTAGAPPDQRFIDMADKAFGSIVTYDASYFDQLTAILAESRPCRATRT
jgi:hypothetical protein